jgi:hypothetical protein
MGIFGYDSLVEDQTVKRPVAKQKKTQGNRKLLKEIFIHFISSFLLALLRLARR